MYDNKFQSNQHPSILKETHLVMRLMKHKITLSQDTTLVSNNMFEPVSLHCTEVHSRSILSKQSFVSVMSKLSSVNMDMASVAGTNPRI
jgi:hypothetical protein